MTTPALILPAGTRLHGFTIEDVIGIGGMAVVYRARQESLGRMVALKVLSSRLSHDPTFRERFRREAALVAALDHPSLVPVYDFGETDDGAFIAMRYVAGGTLHDVIRRGGLTGVETLQVLGAVGSALDRAHASGVLHRDVKPQNILLSEDGFPYLADFGIARIEASELTEPGGFLGSFAYIAPEVIKGEPPSARSDLYAFAVVAYECFTGAGPFAETESGALIEAHLERGPIALEPAGDELAGRADAVLRAGVAKDPADRPGSAADFVEQLRASLAGAGADALGRRPAFPAAHRPAPIQDTAAGDEFPEPAAVTAVIIGGAALGLGAGQPPGPSFLETGVFSRFGGATRTPTPAPPSAPVRRTRRARALAWWPAGLATLSLLLPAAALMLHGRTPAATTATLRDLSFDIAKSPAGQYHLTDNYDSVQGALDGLQPSLVVSGISDKNIDSPSAHFGVSLLAPTFRKAFTLAPTVDLKRPQGRLVEVRGGTVMLYRYTRTSTAKYDPGETRMFAVAQAGSTVVIAGCAIEGQTRAGLAMCVNAIKSLRYEGAVLDGAPQRDVASVLSSTLAAVAKVRGADFTITARAPRRAKAREIAAAYGTAARSLEPLAAKYVHDGEIAGVRRAMLDARAAFTRLADATTEDRIADRDAAFAVAATDQALGVQLNALGRRGYHVEVTQ